MAVVLITLNSDSESESEVEIVGSYSNKNDILPLSSVRVEVNALNITTPVPCIDLTDRQSVHAEQNYVSRHNLVPFEVVDLTEEMDVSCEDNLLPSEDCQIVEMAADPEQQSSKVKLPKTCPKHFGNALEASKICLIRENFINKKSHFSRPVSVKLRRLSIVENHLKELLTLDRRCVINTQTMSLHFKNGCCEEEVCPELSYTTKVKCYKPFTEAQQDQSCQQKATGSNEEPLSHCRQADNIHLAHQIPHPTFSQDTDELSAIPSPACASSSDKAHGLFSKEPRSTSPSLPIGTSTVHPLLGKIRSRSPAHPSTVSSEDVKSDPLSHDIFDKFDSGSCSYTSQVYPSVGQTTNMDEDFFTCEDEFEDNSADIFIWGEQDDANESLELCSTSTTEEDKYYVCPTAAKNRMHRGEDCLTNEQDTRKLQMLCRQSLSLVYSTIDEGYQEGTLQFLSDLLVPGYFPPKDVTAHLLWGILLNPQSPHHNRVHAFDLLMRTQRYHFADKWSVPWDWEKLSFVLEKQEIQPEMLCMFLEYVTQTLEDDFKAKQTAFALNQSIAKAMLSFDQFSHIRDVCKWLFSAIVKSTDCNEMGGEQISRIVALLQRMLSLALEVDCSPAICSAKLSQELFHMIISGVMLRSQRMMLLEGLQSKLLMCKLLEHLLDYSCPVKTSVPMSLSLLLHFLKNCTLSPDPNDQTEKWRRWDELVCLLWMLLLSYNKAMKGYLCGSKTERKHGVGSSVYKPEDRVSKCAVHEAVDAFLFRSKDDIGEALPLHVEESLTYLQDHLLDVCQC